MSEGSISRTRRTRSGCTTCRRRRKKCDEGRPSCQTCHRLGIECGGYEVPLIWGNGVASRGKLKGATLPIKNPSPRKNIEGNGSESSGKDSLTTTEAQSIVQGMGGPSTNSVDHALSYGAVPNPGPQDYGDEDGIYLLGGELDEDELSQELYETLINEFFTSGHQMLHSGSKDDSPVINLILPLARCSSTLRSVCVTYQALFSQIPVTQFRLAYNNALQLFRLDLKDPEVCNEDSTIAAGLLLCSIGNIPWSFHIKPLLELLSSRPDSLKSAFHKHALEVIGWYDLPSFVLNRRCARLDIWQTYCTPLSGESDDREPVSGIPRSLLTILACLEEPDCEEKLWHWQGPKGGMLEIVLWDAYKFSAMLKHRELKRDYCRALQGLGLKEGTLVGDPPTNLPSDMLLLNRLVSCLHIIGKMHDESASDSQVLNAIIYPLFIAGSQVDLLQSNPQWEKYISEVYSQMIAMGRTQVEPMRKILDIMREDRSSTPDQLAARMGLEIALL